ncbi:glycosyl hydrolase catalytic core-domain-containing protein [Mycena floridula]|nr:glycosyl hydrolase catalytic core-domain-containing protein [Mycena floridula]
MFLLAPLVTLFFQCSLTTAFNKTSKRGISFPATNNPADLLNVNQTHSQISWVYDWGLDIPAPLLTSNLEYIPMQYGLGNIENLAASLQAHGAKTVLGFNEPDFDQQSDLDPTYAAQLWIKYMNPLKDLISGIRIGGPAVSSSGSGQPWLEQFFAACNSNCKMDFLPLHWYGVGVAGLYDYLFQIHGQYPNLTIWMTEYAGKSHLAGFILMFYLEVITFLNQTAAYFDTLPWVERYAWFGYFRPENGSAYNFLDADGGLNALGKAYIGAGTVEKSGPLTAVPTAPVPGGGPTRALVTVSVATDGAIPTFTSSAIARWSPSPLLLTGFLMFCALW